MISDSIKMTGYIRWELCENGAVVAQGEENNLITQLGRQMYAMRSLGFATPPAAPTGMKLGQGSAQPSLTGAGAALATYLSGSQQAFAAGYPSSGPIATGYQATYQSVWASGVATTPNPITEVVIVNEALADATSAAAATISRALITGLPSKTASQALTISWTHNF